MKSYIEYKVENVPMIVINDIEMYHLDRIKNIDFDSYFKILNKETLDGVFAIIERKDSIILESKKRIKQILKKHFNVEDCSNYRKDYRVKDEIFIGEDCRTYSYYLTLK